MSSFRCEAYGILSALCFILHLQRYYHLPPRNITIDWWCDCNSLLQRLVPLTIPDPNRFKLADHDTELTFRYLQNQLPSITHNHLHSHLHDHTPLHLLPVPQKLNRIVDDIAKTYNKHMTAPATKALLLGPAGCHLQQRLQISYETFDLIAWDKFAQAFKSFSPESQRILHCWIYGFLPTQQ